jgi:hypothetical protein
MLHLEMMIDLEHRVSGFLRDAIQCPTLEPQVCEALCEFIMELVQAERAIGKQKTREAVELMKSCWRPGQEDTPEPYK